MNRFGDILLLFNEPRSEPGSAAWKESDAGVLAEVEAVSNALAALGLPCRRKGLRALSDLWSLLSSSRPGPVINLVESLPPSPFDACMVPAACAAAGRSCTGNGTACQVLALDKWTAKAAMEAAGVRVPAALVVPPGATPPAERLPPGPLIVKPLRTDASEGIDGSSVLPSGAADGLAALVRRIHEQFAQPALVEQYIEGREINVSLIEKDGELLVLPLAEIDFSAFPPESPRIVDYAAKWQPNSFAFQNTPRRIPAPLEDEVAARTRESARAAWHALGCRDYARVDLRVDAQGIPFVIEVNPNPDISPDAGFAAALQAAGIPFQDFVRALLQNAAQSPAAPAQPLPKAAGRSPIAIRRSEPADREAILAIVNESRVFRPGEVAVAAEVLDNALAAGPAGHYQSFTAVREDRVLGWICFGPTPCTENTFDIYWIGVHPKAQRERVGSALADHAEQAIRERGGRLMVVETSGKTLYAPAQAFYARHGFHLSARVPAFYDKDDDKLIFVKEL